jgi:hypothetical protein
MRTLPRSGQLSDNHLMHQRNVRRHIENFVGQFHNAGG